VNLKNIPGTILEKEKMDNATGMNFLNKVFYITNGIMLGQIREISGIDGTTLQNWVKRGWVGNPTKKTYDKEQLARILIINMMRDTMQLSRVIFLLTYVNGEDERDRIVTESQFYDYICQTLERVASPDSAGLNDLEPMIENVLAEYEEVSAGAKRRLAAGIRIVVITYYAALVKAVADATLDALGADPKRKR
jgi:DNA-binding transcriptional MerR regulator